jgi:hypothetical protein
MNELVKGKVERGALADSCFRPSATVVLLDDLLHSGQANPDGFSSLNEVCSAPASTRPAV